MRSPVPGGVTGQPRPGGGVTEVVRYPNDIVAPSSPPDARLDEAVRGVALAARALERRLDELSLAQLRILSLVEADPMRATALAERAALSKPTLSGLIDGLVGRGWVTRAAVDGDRRGVALRITAAGGEALRRARAEGRAALAELLADVPAANRNRVVAALAALGTAAEAGGRRRARQVMA
jgi:DNA-binding MarR family transcriptional regulator